MNPQNVSASQKQRKTNNQFHKQTYLKKPAFINRQIKPKLKNYFNNVNYSTNDYIKNKIN